MNNNRRISLKILEEAINNNAYSNLAVSSHLNRLKDVDKRDKAFITELTNGTLRNIIYIDYIIGQFSSVPNAKINHVVMNILRQGVYQLMFMDTPPYAVCSEAVDICKERGLKGLSGFVNGVLRGIQRNKANIKLPDENNESVKYLSVRYSMPNWLAERWVNRYGYGFALQMCEKNNEAPTVTIRVNTLKTDAGHLTDVLRKENVEVTALPYDKNGLSVKNSGGIANLSAYKDGLFHVQDMASQLACLILNPQKDSVVLDLCAAPGGKSFTCAFLMENTGKIFARDIYTHKIKLIEEGADRLSISNINTQKQRAELPDEALLSTADYVIVDAPCTGLGLLRKKPDIKFNKTEDSIYKLSQLQREILTQGARYVKSGGVLLYSTCTLTDEENTHNVNWFLKEFDFVKEDFTELLHECLIPYVKDNCLTLYPHIHETDGFFISKFKRR